MTTLKQQAATDINMFFETGLPWVSPGTYIPETGDPVSGNFIYEETLYNEPDGYETKASKPQRTIEALRAVLGQIPVARTSTRPGDLFEIDSVKYRVSGIEEMTNDIVVCNVVED